ncbi:spermatogenesis-associated protein 4-like [Corticium candelabrum]|uniref:spermatogenesis-associated protein 4-like n=1 Tax=Corticium candelabrum TaxID=121492 RepID=UPI002E25F241|nr:spermatogenesis-associated protein 4-like [Corticium candelabrum]
MSGLPREVLKWLQSLDLTHSVKNTRRDFSNGYLVAEIFSWYYPQDIQMHSFVNGTSIERKMGNWQQLERFFQRHQLGIAKERVDGTIHCKPGAAIALVEQVYTLLTNRKVRKLEKTPNDFTDSSYQSQLPSYARSTASQAIKNNIAITELTTQPDRIVSMQKAQNIVDTHVEHRRQEREHNPERFGIRAGDSLSPRHATGGAEPKSVKDSKQQESQEHNTEGSSAVKEVEVSQPSKPAAP